MENYLANENGFYGEFGGTFVPEVLHACINELKDNYLKIIQTDSFRKEFNQLLKNYVGRPSPLYLAKRLSAKYGAKIYLKREDLNHTGAHKINNTIGQILLAKQMNKNKVIAETGAGQWGSYCNCMYLMELNVSFYGKTDIERQRINVEKMKKCLERK